jgi:AhpD family alkylhydroperoxidase
MHLVGSSYASSLHRRCGSRRPDEVDLERPERVGAFGGSAAASHRRESSDGDVDGEDRMQTETAVDAFELFHREFPALAERFDALVDAQIEVEGLDRKTKQLINIAIQTANRTVPGLSWHAAMAVRQGATRAEVLGAVVLNLHHSGLGPVLEALPEAVRGVEMAERGELPSPPPADDV